MLRGTFGVNLDNFLTSFFSFENEDINELTPTRVSNTFVEPRFSRLPIRQKRPRFLWFRFSSSGHILYVQILNKHHIGFRENFLSRFKMKLFPLSCNFLVQLGNFAVEQLTGAASFFGNRCLLLQSRQLDF